MAKMGIEAVYRKPNTSKRRPCHPVYPYLLRGRKIEWANEVCAMDITYIPMARGWVYLAAVVDWASHNVLAHRVSISMDTTFCLEALEEAFARHHDGRLLPAARLSFLRHLPGHHPATMPRLAQRRGSDDACLNSFHSSFRELMAN